MSHRRFYGGRYRNDESMVNDEVQRRIGHPPSILGYSAQLTSIALYSSLLRGRALISAPTLILAAGDDDPIVATINLEGDGQAHPPLGASRDSEGRSHLLLLDSSETIAPIIADFLDSGSPGAERSNVTVAGRVGTK